MTRWIWFLPALLFAALSACGGDAAPTAAVYLDLKTDYIPGIEFVAVETSLFDAFPQEGGTATALAQQYATTTSVMPLRVAEFEELKPGPAILRVRLFSHDGALLLEHWIIVEAGGGTTATAVMTRDCAGVSCPGAGDNPAALACLGGRCVDPRCIPENPEFCPEGSCTSVEDCSAVASCANQRCDFGVCLPIIRPLSCAAGTYCQPETGCVPAECAAPGSLGNGEPCGGNTDCTAVCIANICADPASGGGTCDPGENEDCSGSLECPGGTCVSPNGTPCSADNECVGVCNGTTCVDPNQPNGAGCDENTDCLATCIAGLCADPNGPTGPCDDEGDCSGILVCSGGFCAGPVPVFVAPPAAIATGDPVAVRLADVNGDTVLDAITKNNGVAGQLGASVLLGTGDGTFLQTIHTAHPGRIPAAADMNEDGIADLIYPDIPWLVVQPGVGNWNLGGQIRHTFMGSASSVLTGDFNNDGHVDVVGNLSSAAEVAVSLGAGDGTLAPPTSLTIASPSAIALGDLNGDGDLDVAAINTLSGMLTGLLGAGDGTLVPAASLPLPRTGGKLALADLDEDGTLDAITNNPDDNSLTIVRGVGDGTFSFVSHVAVGSSPREVMAHDLDTDGHLDLVSVNEDSTNITALLGTGTGTFSAPLATAAGVSPVSLQVGDLDGDGVPDVAVAGRDVLGFLRGAGDGTFFSAPSYMTTSAVSALAAGDLNGDGVPDVVAAMQSAGVEVLSGAAEGTLSTGTPFPLPSAGSALELADVNGDGDLDLVSLHAGSNRFAVSLGDGTGAFASATSFTVGTNPRAVALTDVNGDGHLDVLVANYDSGDLTVSLGTGGGSFAAASSIPAGPGPAFIEVMDINGDSNVDVLVGNARSDLYTPYEVWALLGAGDGSFAAAPVTITTTFPLAAIAAGDLNGDGVVDVLAGTNAEMDRFLGNGDGTFGGGLTLPGEYLHVKLTDLNGDAILDALVGGNTHVLLGVGDGTFTESSAIMADPSVMALADLNRDTRPDLIVGAGNAVQVILQAP